MVSEPRSSCDWVGVRLEVTAATRADIAAHLLRCDSRFIPRLSSRLDIADYAGKIHGKAVTFEAWNADDLVGLVAAYLNDPVGEDGYVTSVSVERAFQGSGLASTLMQTCIHYARERGFTRIGLEVGAANRRAVELYRRLGFETSGQSSGLLRMTLVLER